MEREEVAEQSSALTRHEIEAGLTPQQVRLSQFVCSALLFGPLVLLAIVLFFYIGKLPQASDMIGEGRESMGVLFIAFIIAAAVLISLAVSLPAVFLKPALLKKLLAKASGGGMGRRIDDPVEKLIALERMSMILRFALLEAASVFGLVVLLIAVTDGLIFSRPYFWLGAAPVLIQAAFTICLFPARDRILSNIEHGLLPVLRGF